MKKLFSRKYLWLSLGLALLFAIIFYVQDSNKVRLLENVFPVLEKYEVRYFENQNWTKSLGLVKGSVFQTNYPTHRDTFNEEYMAIHREIAFSLRFVPVMEVYHISNIEYVDGKVDYADFSFRNGFHLDGYQYVYDRTPGSPKEHIIQQIVDSKRINEHWTFVRTDWN